MSASSTKSFVSRVKSAATKQAAKKANWDKKLKKLSDRKSVGKGANSTICKQLQSMKGKLSSPASDEPDNRINSAMRKHKCSEEESTETERTPEEMQKIAQLLVEDLRNSLKQ